MPKGELTFQNLLAWKKINIIFEKIFLPCLASYIDLIDNLSKIFLLPVNSQKDRPKKRL